MQLGSPSHQHLTISLDSHSIILDNNSCGIRAMTELHPSFHNIESLPNAIYN